MKNKVLCVLKWIYRVLNYIVRGALLVGLLYAVFFSLAGTYLIYKTVSYGYSIYEAVDTLKVTQPVMSKYMQTLQDSLKDSLQETEFKHRYVPLDSISPYLQRAVIASEDAGFYFHPGFDVRAIAEALAQNQARGKTKFGGSTLTQQLAKNLFLSNERSWERKFKEFAFALLMEKQLGKKRILELYLNYAEWGKNIFGCEAASQVYYKKSCAKLNIDQAINLAAVLASPTKHHPYMRQSQFMAKRRTVIYQNMFPPRDSVLKDSLEKLQQPVEKDTTNVLSNDNSGSISKVENQIEQVDSSANTAEE